MNGVIPTTIIIIKINEPINHPDQKAQESTANIKRSIYRINLELHSPWPQTLLTEEEKEGSSASYPGESKNFWNLLSSSASPNTGPQATQ